jgi:hypothetical protein
MTEPTDHDDPHGTGPGATPDPFPVFGRQATFSPFPPLEPEAEPVVTAAVEPDPPSDWNEKADAHDLIERENRLKAMARFAFPPGPPPDDDRRWTTRTILVVTAFMAVFNAVSVPNWSRQQAPGWVNETVGGIAEVWARQVSLLGADMPRQGVREAYQTVRDSKWAGQGEQTPQA